MEGIDRHSVTDAFCMHSLPCLGSLCCVVFLGKTLNSHSASLYSSVQRGASEFVAGE